MTLHELMLFLHHLEETYPVNDWEIDGIHAWPLIRCRMGATVGINSTIQNQNQKTETNDYTKWKSRINAIIQPFLKEARMHFHDRKHSSKIYSADVVMCVLNEGRTIMLPTGELMHRLMGPIREAFENRGYSVFAFEHFGDVLKFPRWRASYSINIMALTAVVKSKFTMYRRSNIEADAYVTMQRECRKFGFSEELLSPVNIFFSMRFIEEFAFQFLVKLKKIKPRIVFIVGWDSVYSMALTLAAHRLQLPVVDIQHGMTACTHVHYAYNDWSQIPVEGYEVMPDYMWVWWQEDYDAISCWGGDKVVPILGGRPSGLLWGNPDSKLVDYYQSKYGWAFSNNRPTILVTLQWATHYPDWLVDFINENEAYTWLVRLHQVIDEGERAFLQKLEVNSNIIWKGIEECPLDFLLSKVSLHITMNSSVVWEAAEFNCHSVFMDSSGYEYFVPQIEKGIARYVNSGEELSSAIKDIMTKRHDNYSNNHREDFYKLGQSGIDKLIEIMDKKI